MFSTLRCSRDREPLGFEFKGNSIASISAGSGSHLCKYSTTSIVLVSLLFCVPNVHLYAMKVTELDAAQYIFSVSGRIVHVPLFSPFQFMFLDEFMISKYIFRELSWSSYNYVPKSDP